MRSFLMAPFTRRLAICGAVSFALVLAAYGLLVLASLDDWRATGVEQKKWQAGKKEKCESLFDRARAEIKAIDSGRCSFDKDIKEGLDCKDAERRLRAELISIASRSDCPAIPLEPGELPLLLPPSEPSHLLEYALESRGMHPPIIPAGMFALTALMFILSDMGKRLVLESHIGWRRLSLVVAIAIPAAVVGWWMHDGEGPEETFMAGLVALACASISVVYGRAVFLWVAEGFGKPCGRPSTTGTAEPTLAATAAASTASFTAEPEAAPKIEIPNVAWKPASYWPRFWARCLDLPLCWILGSIPGAFIPDIRSAVGGPFGIVLDALAGMAVICLVLFYYEAFFVSRFGATPGKMMFGLQVRSVDDRPPTWDEAKRRGWSYLKSGLYFTLFLPVMQILGAFMAWKRRDESQPWDMAGRTHVRQKPIGMLRFACAVLASFIAVSAMVVSHKVIKEGTKEEIRRSVLR